MAIYYSEAMCLYLVETMRQLGGPPCQAGISALVRCKAIHRKPGLSEANEIAKMWEVQMTADITPRKTLQLCHHHAEKRNVHKHRALPQCTVSQATKISNDAHCRQSAWETEPLLTRLLNPYGFCSECGKRGHLHKDSRMPRNCHSP